MSPNQRETTLKFEIKSLDPGRPTIEAVPEAENLSSELQATIAARFPGATVQIRRAEGIPAVRELQELLLYVDWQVVKEGVETAIATFATTEFLKLVKAKLRNVFAKPVPEPTPPAVATPTERPKRNRSTSQAKKKTSKPARKSSRGSKKKSRSARNKRKR
jgi:hypothetical protein